MNQTEEKACLYKCCKCIWGFNPSLLFPSHTFSDSSQLLCGNMKIDNSVHYHDLHKALGRKINVLQDLEFFLSDGFRYKTSLNISYKYIPPKNIPICLILMLILYKEHIILSELSLKVRNNTQALKIIKQDCDVESQI